MTIALRYAVRSDVGLLREGNEDSAYAGPHLLAVADGMGGHAAGEVASAVAISALAPLDTAQAIDTDLLQALADAVGRANVRLHEITQSDPSTEGMGTTLTALLWSGDHAGLCHIGDSRAYLLRDGAFYQITHDHTLVQSLVDDGRLTKEAAASHPQRSLVMRALQSSVPAEPDLTMVQPQQGDRFLLCSDGLSDVVSDETMHKTLLEIADLDQAVEQLVDLAIRSGGPDNITCILADVLDPQAWDAVPNDLAVLAGAVAAGDIPAPSRSDSPAARAHRLTHGEPSQDDGDPAPDREVASRAFSAADGATALHGQPAGSDGRTATFDGLAATPDGADPALNGHVAALGNGGPQHRGRHAAGQPADDELAAIDEEDDDDDDARSGRHAAPGRRRWPVVTFILLVLIGVIGAGGYYGWRITQDQYFVGLVNGHVAVFRGVNEPVAGISLFSVVQRTGIPVAAMPVSEAEHVRTTIPARNLAQARQIVSRINRDYRCDLAHAAISRWLAGRPKPVPPHARHPRGTRGRGATSQARSGSHTITTPKPHAYPPRPVLPPYCTDLAGGAG